jgi:hypothetical protein
MPQLTTQLIERTPGLLGRRLTERTQKLVQAEQDARKVAAGVATQTTRNSFRYLRPANAPKRPGRESTGGQFRDELRWVARSGPDAPVEFDIRAADSKVPYWIIQEIGTGESATLRRGGAANPVGRPASGATYVRTVRSQRGRLISIGLAFASGPRGVYSPPSAAHGQQLYLRSKLTGRFGRMRGVDQLVITKEIKGQHFVQKGGQEGFREYRTSVLAAARRAFDGRGRRP